MRLIIFLTAPFIVIAFSFIFVFLPVYAAYTPTTPDNTCAAGAVAVVTTGGLECKLAGDILGAGVTVNSGTLTACSDDELFWTDNGKIKCVALNCPGTNKYLSGFKDGASVCHSLPATAGDASTSVKGSVELATKAEAGAGTSATLVVTPSGLPWKVDDSGTTKYVVPQNGTGSTPRSVKAPAYFYTSDERLKNDITALQS